MQHRAHFLRGQVDIRAALIGQQKTVAITVALDGPLHFLQQPRGGI